MARRDWALQKIVPLLRRWKQDGIEIEGVSKPLKVRNKDLGVSWENYLVAGSCITSSSRRSIDISTHINVPCLKRKSMGHPSRKWRQTSLDWKRDLTLGCFLQDHQLSVVDSGHILGNPYIQAMVSRQTSNRWSSRGGFTSIVDKHLTL
ncbi:hypothetical protein Ae201684_016406 [Aphanomyces euteiches]|uniref:Uncharacterized protein n=1 Tax=Aphanomyces euteiches TaxID=100861 RepID=A0A6G0WCH1_9STRA|nr:hypothetical protein Ae201684_016406 [Aphanomyces euteiches]